MHTHLFNNLESQSAIPAENEAKSLNTKEDDEKSLRNEILQPIDSKIEKHTAGIAESQLLEK